MRITKEALSTTLLVRRIAVGATPFRWEVHSADTAEPLHISPDRFASMEAAYRAGQARLAEFVPKRSLPIEPVGNHRWKASRASGGEAQAQQAQWDDAGRQL